MKSKSIFQRLKLSKNIQFCADADIYMDKTIEDWVKYAVEYLEH
mgnify:CR=1 FL=1